MTVRTKAVPQRTSRKPSTTILVEPYSISEAPDGNWRELLTHKSCTKTSLYFTAVYGNVTTMAALSHYNQNYPKSISDIMTRLSDYSIMGDVNLTAW